MYHACSLCGLQAKAPYPVTYLFSFSPHESMCAQSQVAFNEVVHEFEERPSPPEWELHRSAPAKLPFRFQVPPGNSGTLPRCGMLASRERAVAFWPALTQPPMLVSSSRVKVSDAAQAAVVAVQPRASLPDVRASGA